MAIISINQLPNKTSDKKSSSIIPLDQLPSKAQEKSPVKEALDNTGSIMINALARPANTYEGITGGAGQAFAQNIKRELLDRSIPSNGLFASSFKEAVVQGTYGGNILLPKAMEHAARPGELMKASKNAMTKAEKLATQILQPTTKDLSESFQAGRPLPSIKRGAENIAASRTFPELVDSLKSTTKELFNERDMILKENNVPIGGEALESLSELTRTANRDKVLSPAKIRVFDNVFYRELQFLEENPTMDVISAQSRKEKLQELTRPLLEKRRAGTLTGGESAELQAYDALRSGYRKAILKALPKDKAGIVDKINSKYEGLLDATELASTQAAKSIKEVPQSLLDKIASSFGLSPQFTAFRLATREVAGLVGKTRLERSTAKISELRNKAETLRQLARMARKAQLSNKA